MKLKSQTIRLPLYLLLAALFVAPLAAQSESGSGATLGLADRALCGPEFTRAVTDPDSLTREDAMRIAVRLGLYTVLPVLAVADNIAIAAAVASCAPTALSIGRHYFDQDGKPVVETETVAAARPPVRRLAPHELYRRQPIDVQIATAQAHFGEKLAQSEDAEVLLREIGYTFAAGPIEQQYHQREWHAEQERLEGERLEGERLEGERLAERRAKRWAATRYSLYGLMALLAAAFMLRHRFDGSGSALMEQGGALYGSLGAAISGGWGSFSRHLSEVDWEGIWIGYVKPFLSFMGVALLAMIAISLQVAIVMARVMGKVFFWSLMVILAIFTLDQVRRR